MLSFEGQFALLNPEFDFTASRAAELRYMVASTPRSGSSYLCQLLWQTGRMGAPLEYFNFHAWMPAMTSRLQVMRLREYVERLFQLRVSPNGVFGFKAHVEHAQFLKLANLWPVLKPDAIVRISRKDKVAQAVSLVIANETGVFSSLDGQQSASRYDRQKIADMLRYIEHCDAYWDRLLSGTQTPVKIVWYEQLREHGPDIVSDVARFLGVENAPAKPVSLPSFRRQAGNINDDWINRFKSDSSST